VNQSKSSMGNAMRVWVVHSGVSGNSMTAFCVLPSTSTTNAITISTIYSAMQLASNFLIKGECYMLVWIVKGWIPPFFCGFLVYSNAKFVLKPP
jgi:hypothetical protein